MRAVPAGARLRGGGHRRRPPRSGRSGRPRHGLADDRLRLRAAERRRRSRRWRSWRARFGVTPWRSIVLPGIGPERDAEIAALGGIVDRDDPRLSVIACPGRPACPSAIVATEADAAALLASGAPTELGPPVRLREGLRPSGRGRDNAGGRGRRPILPRSATDERTTGPSRPGSPSRRRARRLRPGPHDARLLRDGAAIYARSFAIIRAEADLVRFHAERGAGRGAGDPRVRHGRGRPPPPLRARLHRRRADGAARGRADPVRRQDGRARHHPRPAACRATR